MNVGQDLPGEPLQSWRCIAISRTPNSAGVARHVSPSWRTRRYSFGFAGRATKNATVTSIPHMASSRRSATCESDSQAQEKT